MKTKQKMMTNITNDITDELRANLLFYLGEDKAPEFRSIIIHKYYQLAGFSDRQDFAKKVIKILR